MFLKTILCKEGTATQFGNKLFFQEIWKKHNMNAIKLQLHWLEDKFVVDSGGPCG